MAVLVANVKIAADGSLILPPAVREAVGLKGESTLIVRVEDGEVKLSPLGKGFGMAQALYRKHVKNERSSDEFLASRARD
jgi:bifunctional DNA-binding transcriptional regulator/antitoxin component of YhaV-PrlF toxin-antitoxin module